MPRRCARARGAWPGQPRARCAPAGACTAARPRWAQTRDLAPAPAHAHAPSPPPARPPLPTPTPTPRSCCRSTAGALCGVGQGGAPRRCARARGAWPGQPRARCAPAGACTAARPRWAQTRDHAPAPAHAHAPSPPPACPPLPNADADAAQVLQKYGLEHFVELGKAVRRAAARTRGVPGPGSPGRAARLRAHAQPPAPAGRRPAIMPPRPLTRTPPPPRPPARPCQTPTPRRAARRCAAPLRARAGCLARAAPRALRACGRMHSRPPPLGADPRSCPRARSRARPLPPARPPAPAKRRRRRRAGAAEVRPCALRRDGRGGAPRRCARARGAWPGQPRARCSPAGACTAARPRWAQTRDLAPAPAHAHAPSPRPPARPCQRQRHAGRQGGAPRRCARARGAWPGQPRARCAPAGACTAARPRWAQTRDLAPAPAHAHAPSPPPARPPLPTPTPRRAARRCAAPLRARAGCLARAAPGALRACGRMHSRPPPLGADPRSCPGARSRARPLPPARPPAPANADADAAQLLQKYGWEHFVELGKAVRRAAARARGVPGPGSPGRAARLRAHAQPPAPAGRRPAIMPPRPLTRTPPPRLPAPAKRRRHAGRQGGAPRRCARARGAWPGQPRARRACGRLHSRPPPRRACFGLLVCDQSEGAPPPLCPVASQPLTRLLR